MGHLDLPTQSRPLAVPLTHFGSKSTTAAMRTKGRASEQSFNVGTEVLPLHQGDTDEQLRSVRVRQQVST